MFVIRVDPVNLVQYCWFSSSGYFPTIAMGLVER